MTQPLTEALVEAAREAAQPDAWERDRVAWNLPRASPGESTVESTEEPPLPPSAALDWAGFVQAFYPESRRHDLGAIAAYADYRRSTRDA